MNRNVLRSVRLAVFLLVWSAGAGPRPLGAQTLTLGAAADSALSTHPSVKAAQASVDAANADRRAARAIRLPSLVASGGLLRFEEPMVVAPLHGFDPARPPDFDRTLVQGQLGLDLTLFDGGARGARIRAADELGASAARRKTASEMLLLAAVSDSYVSLLAGRAVLAAADRQVASLEAELTRAGQRLREGTTARVEVLRAEAALRDSEADRATARARVGLAERGLARLMGVAPGSIGALRDVRVPTAVDPDGGVDPRVEAARRVVAAAQARVAQERAGRLPTFRASAGLQNFGSGTGEFVTEWQAGLRVSWPLFTGGGRSSAIARAEADLRAAQEELRAAELTVASELDGAEAARVEAAARFEALEAAVAQWEEVARIEALALEAGSGVQQDFLRAEAALFRARAGRARARYDLVLAHVARARVQGRLDRAWIDDALEVR
ncbi:MAG: TolC family protein [Gemmatimonadota bacterium]|jgi:outer membrane protein